MRNKDVMSRKERQPSGSLLIDVRGLSLRGVHAPLFFDVSFNIHEGEVLGLIGSGGSGKSTLLRTLIGMQNPYQGEVLIPNKVTAQYVPQVFEDLDFDEDPTIQNLMLEARGLLALELKMRELEIEMDENFSESVMMSYSHVQEEYGRLGGWDSDHAIAEILAGVGLSNIPVSRQINQLSSGQKRKILVARSLFAHPDLLILDEPTSHLDAESTAWLISYLQRTNQGAIVATNNLSLLKSIPSQILELTQGGRPVLFSGNIEEFEQQKSDLMGYENTEIKKQQAKVSQLKETVARFKSMGDKRSKKAARRRKVIERRAVKLDAQLSQLKDVAISDDGKYKQLSFSELRRSGNDVLLIRGVKKSYPESNVPAVDLSNIEILVERGQRLAVVGPNGSGKSTLFRMIIDADLFGPDEGIIKQGSNVEIGYFSPSNDLGEDGERVIEVAKRLSGYRDEKAVRSVLAFWGFTGGKPYQRTLGSLSQGERIQLQLAGIMLREPNVLILDEPTGNLSIDMKNRLAKSLEQYDGTLLVVSHEQEFLENLGVNSVLRLPSGEYEDVYWEEN